MRNNPHIYEINLMTWLAELSLREKRRIRLKDIPREEWRHLKSLGMDFIWLMGMWQRSPYSIDTARKEPFLLEEGTRLLPDFTINDIAGSPYAIYDYIPDTEFGSKEELVSLKNILEEEGLFLLLDFVPNHTACDHPWINKYPDRYIIKNAKGKNICEEGYFLSGEKNDYICVAHGKDPNFPHWSDTAQINYAKQDTVNAMAQTILELTNYCYGLRCDMAMLPLKNIFLNTWSEHLNGKSDAQEFWPYALDLLKIEGIPFRLIAEVYWGMEKELLDCGFDYVYDKDLYDFMIEGNIENIRDHISLPVDHQEKMVRFLENHDEPRALQKFGSERVKSAMVMLATLPGMRFWHHGQLEGRTHRVPVQLRREPDETPDNNLLSFAENLLREVNHSVFHDGVFRICNTHGWPDNNSHANLIAYCWEKNNEKRLIIVNFSPFSSQGYVKLPDTWIFTHSNLTLVDPIKNESYKPVVSEIIDDGLYVGLEKSDYHFFKIIEE